MQRKLSALFVVLFLNAVGGGVPPVEARTNLNGPYAFTTFRSCTVANSPFINDASGAPTVVPAGGVFRQNTVDSGIQTFNEDGTGTITGRSTTMNVTAGGGSILNISEFSLPFTYTVNADDTVDISLGQATFAIVLGNGTGNTGTASPRSARVQIGNGANTLVTAPRIEIEQETVNINVLIDGTFTQYRLCVRSGPQVKMPR